MKLLTIGRLADACGLTADTIRFYEKRTLIQPANRSAAGYRLYSLTVLQRLEFIQSAKEVGFTLNEIQQLLLLMDDPQGSCAEVRSYGHQKVVEIERKITALSHMREALVPLLNECSGKGPRSECPILDALKNKHVSQ